MTDRPRRAMTDRSTSVILNYILVLAITTILITGLIIAGGNFVEDNRERVIHSELTVIGNHVAGNLEQVDRLVQASEDDVGDDPEVAHVNQSFQDEVTGSHYNVLLDDGDPVQVVVNSTQPEVSVRVNVTIQTDVRKSHADGGPISVYYDEDSDELVIDND